MKKQASILITYNYHKEQICFLSEIGLHYDTLAHYHQLLNYTKICTF